MVKRIGRRFVSLLLTFVTILTMLPAMTLPALAATSGTVTGLADQNIGLSFNGTADNAWSASSTQIIGKARSTSGSGCGGGSNYRSTLTIKNNKTTKATLSFDYTVVVSEGTILVNIKTTTTAGSFSQELGAGGTVEVEIESGSTSADTMITMTNVKLVSDVNATATFVPAENGTYTVDGKLITEKYSNTQSSMTAYEVVATPAEDYRFKGWYDVDSGKCISTDAKTALNFDSNRTITARFVSKELALFETGGQVFDDLNEAIAEAQKKLPAIITLAESGKITGNYTIPSKVTLLIPFDEAKTCYTSTPTAITSTPTAKPFRTLTMATGSSITLANGAAISVGGQYYAASGGKKGQMVGPYGYIKMDSGSAIDVQSGASLYAWGFISGSGSVTVQSGGSVYEWYQILDFRGGSASSDMGNKVFPFSQYAVQNVEVPLTLHAGASETAYTAVYAMRQALRDGSMTQEQLMERLTGSGGGEPSQPDAESAVPASRPESGGKTDAAPETPDAAAAGEKSEQSAESSYQKELSALIAKVYVLREEYTLALDTMYADAKAEYLALPAEKRTTTQLAKMAKGYLSRANALEKECDGKMDEVIRAMETLIRDNNGDLGLVDTVVYTYANEKSLKKSWYMSKLEQKGLL